MKKAFTDSESLEQYLSSLDILQEAVLLIDAKGIVHGSSSNVLEDLGYDNETELPGTLFEINPNLNLRTWTSFWKKMEEQGPQLLDTEHITREGIIFPVKINGMLIRQDDQTVAYCRISNVRETRVHKQLLKLTSKLSGIGGWQWGVLNDHITITDSLYDLLELEKPMEKPDPTWIRQQLDQFLQKGSLESLIHLFNNSIRTGKETSLEIPFTKKDGSSTVLHVRIVPVTYGNSTLQVFGTVRDLSSLSRETAEMALARHTLHHSQELIYWLDQSGSFIFANEPFCQRMRVDRNDLVNYRISDFMPGFDETDFRKEWDQLLKEKQVNREGMMKASGERPFPADISISLFRYEEKEYICAVIRDITTRKKLEARQEIHLQKIRKLKEKLEGENALLKEEIKLNYQHEGIITESPKYKKVLHLAEQVALTDTTVLITGETGTGKEMIANTIHRLSNRSSAPMIKVNCAALPPGLIESELFGHEKGAFTGATQQKKGRFERADGGTLFLDEIGDLPAALQAKLLRVLQDGAFERVGGIKTMKVNVRVITATNRNLEQLVDQGKYRKDLYYRLNVYPIHNIPLRERKEDLPALIRHFVDKYSRKMGKTIDKIPRNSIRKLTQYEFPGNIRELENIIERALVLTPGNILQLDSVLPSDSLSLNHGKKTSFKTLDDIQKEHILKALERCRWKVSGKGGAAELLRINPKTLWSRMQKLGIL
jgi:PAS domain S-box-containing protein